MRKSTIPGPAILFCVLCASFFSASQSHASCPSPMATVVSVEGMVEIRHEGSASWVAAGLEEVICKGGMIRVGENSRAALRLANDANLRLDQLTAITFTGVERERSFLMNLVKGAVHFFSRFPKSLKVATPFVNGTVEGTEFAMRVEEDRTTVSVFKGKVRAENAAGALLIAKNQTAVAEKGKAPALHPVARPRDAVAWGLYYPAVDRWDSAPDIEGAGSPFADAVASSLEAYRKNDIPKALKALSEIPEEGGSATLQAYRASLYLTAGRVDRADFHIRRSLFLAPENAQALALQSVLLLVGNQKDEALAVAERAVAAHPESAAVRMAQSYALQAHFRLEEALATLEQAAADHPDHAPVFARIAELKLSTGDVDGGLAAAKKAATLDPGLASAHTILGFAHLIWGDRVAAESVFEKAIAMDSASPLPRLGLGLAIIRGGDLEGGRKQIEIASGLDSGNSLIRSYLGKAYFDETRDGDAEDQYEIAKALDPNDPTPWFYGALAKLTENRPVEALADLEESMARNDNRAVFRSRFQLDEDLAVRSAGLARVYSELGFDQLALLEGYKALAKNPGSYAAHRFLADAYAGLPRHEIGRVSELLQSQLRQPLSAAPVQPRLAETTRHLFETTGLAEPAFNEYQALFLRDRASVQSGVVLGGDGTVAEEVSLSGVADRAAFSVGQSHYNTDGFRENNDQEEDIVNGFVQYRISPKASVQMEVKRKDVDKGDLTVLFDPENFNDNLRQGEKTSSIRFGGHFELNRDSELLFSSNYIETSVDTSTQNDIFFPLPAPLLPLSIRQEIQLPIKKNGFLNEVQYNHHSHRFHWAIGAGYYEIESEDETNLTYTPQFPPIFNSTTAMSEEKERHTNLYAYGLMDFSGNVQVILGGSVESFQNTVLDLDSSQFNPKLGVNWQASPTTTLRIAAFRTLERSWTSQQTLEPSQVAGFNQFFNVSAGSVGWRYGIGIDKKLSAKGVYGGIELSRRDLENPVRNIISGSVDDGDKDEDFIRTYLYWTPRNDMAFSVEYQYESMSWDSNLSRLENVEELETTRVPLGAKFFLPNRITFSVDLTYFHQNGKFGETDAGPSAASVYQESSDSGWITDMAISYRLPHRNGSISIQAKNVFDESYLFQDTDPNNPTFYPGQLILLQCSLTF